LKRLRIPFVALRYLLVVFDALVITAASYLGGGLYQITANGEFNNGEQLIGLGFTAAVLYALIGQSSGFYEIRSTLSRRRDAGRIFANWTFVSLLLALVAFLMKSGAGYSRGSVICFGLLALILLVWSRAHVKGLAASAVAGGQVSGQRAVLLGARDELAALGSHELLESYGISEVDRIAFPEGKGNDLAMTKGQASAVDAAVQVARERGVDEFVLVLPWGDQRKLELVRDRLRMSPLPVQLLPDRRIRSLARNPAYRFRRSLSIEIQREPLSLVERLCKRFVDIVGASIGVVLLAPLMVMTALAVKFDSPGPVFFRQRRNGFNANQFHIFKFRTMTVMEDGVKVEQVRRHDARVTRVGRLLRRTSIDEIPQLINVLRGEMSLVGPRPHALAHDDHYGTLLSEYAFRHHVKPGITGWAQINGYRGETAQLEQMRARIEHDIWYINNWNLLIDLKILLRTCFEISRGRNAY
jgi:undecaprenyl-phosphate galactose phosphotransferase/putative colanic acid biosynthesis UDP-glucose lipid carrier transferase